MTRWFESAAESHHGSSRENPPRNPEKSVTTKDEDTKKIHCSTLFVLSCFVVILSHFAKAYPSHPPRYEGKQSIQNFLLSKK